MSQDQVYGIVIKKELFDEKVPGEIKQYFSEDKAMGIPIMESIMQHDELFSTFGDIDEETGDEPPEYNLWWDVYRFLNKDDGYTFAYQTE